MTAARNLRTIRAPAAKTTITITLLLGNEERVFTIVPTKLPLIFLEALNELTEDGSWKNMRVGIQHLLKLTDEEAMELDTEHIIQISEAVSSVATIPNG